MSNIKSSIVNVSGKRGEALNLCELLVPKIDLNQHYRRTELPIGDIKYSLAANFFTHTFKNYKHHHGNMGLVHGVGGDCRNV